MSYGTPDQMEKLLTSIRQNVEAAPTSTFTEPGVRVVGLELADLLKKRLSDAVIEAVEQLGVDVKVYDTFEAVKTDKPSYRTPT